MTELNVLIVDDEVNVAPGLRRELEDEFEHSGFDGLNIVIADTVGLVREIVDEKSIDLALVDLGLGKAQESGLGAIDILVRTDPKPKIILHTGLHNEADRLMFIYAAYAWFGEHIATHIPKVGDRSGILKSIVGPVLDGTFIDHGNAFRKESSRDLIENVLTTSTDLERYAMLATTQTQEYVSESLRIEIGTLRGWYQRKALEIANLLAAARDTELAPYGDDLERQPSILQATAADFQTSKDRDKAWNDLPPDARKEQHEVKPGVFKFRQRKRAAEEVARFDTGAYNYVSTFAKSQSWFWSDRYVQQRLSERKPTRST